MQRVNFRTKNGLQLLTMLKTGEDVPLHLPTPRNVNVGDYLHLTYGDRTNPTSMCGVIVKHVHNWSNSDGTQVQNLIVNAPNSHCL